MGKRRKARESALQILFQIEFDDSHFENVLTDYLGRYKLEKEIEVYTSWLVKGVSDHSKEIDDMIQSVSENWRISRMAFVDRNILRIAAYEIFFGDELAPAVVINEAIEIAKKYSSDQAATFINGILDALSKKKKIAGRFCEEKDEENGKEKRRKSENLE